MMQPTPRQAELLAHICGGLTIEQAAEKCFIERRSAYNTLASARNRIGAATLTHLAVMALENGWVEKSGKGYTPAALA